VSDKAVSSLRRGVRRTSGRQLGRMMGPWGSVVTALYLMMKGRE